MSSSLNSLSKNFYLRIGIRVKEFQAIKKETISKLKELRNEIQEEERRHNIGKIVYSATGIIAGGLSIAGVALSPFTFGASLALSIAGVATGASSGIANVSHGIAAHVIIRKKSDEADKLYIKLKTILGVIIDIIEEAFFGITTTIKLGRIAYKIADMSKSSVALHAFRMSDAIENAATSATSSSSKIFGGVFAGIGVVLEIKNLCQSSYNLHTNALHEKVEALDLLIANLESKSTYRIVEELLIENKEICITSRQDLKLVFDQCDIET
ncbi:apolipoprotein L3-like [Saccostrea echinata]|uniref:apolipoprotein L3-like n=1 Tax=Saccostrea echinata TaxID=191078 RepID=UPI002A830622|nr:apolipoprotein L3-like [Saccostrea echinata]